MGKDTRTKEKTRHSFLCKRLSLNVPTGWNNISQEDLRYILRLIWMYGKVPGWQERVLVASFLHFTDIKVFSRTDSGWLCQCRKQTFILDPSLLPELLQPLEWITQLDNVNIRIERVGKWQAVDFELQEMTFGKYLESEGLYQSFLLTHNENLLAELGKRLYNIDDDVEEPLLKDEVLTGVFVWFTAVKQLLSQEFHNFFKPINGSNQQITRENLISSMRTQLRLLTKGDVTKEDYIKNNVDTWTALSELDALAKEAEEIQKKYGK